MSVFFALAVASGIAHSEPQTEVVEGDRIRIESTLDRRAAQNLAPGVSVDWFIDVSASHGEPGRIDISLEERGALGLSITAYRCSVEWRGTSCPAETDVVRESAAVPAEGAPILAIDADEVAYLRFVVGTSEDVPAATTGAFRLVASGLDEEQGIGGPSLPLEPTGSRMPWIVSFAAVGAAGVGMALTSAHMRSNRSRPMKSRQHD